MIAPDLVCDGELQLIEPDINRDPPIGIQWMSGVEGEKTQRLMGIAPNDIHEHTFAEEVELFKNFISTDDEIVWMIEYQGKIIGIVEVGTKIPPEENGPSISIMLGDASARGKGIGKRVMTRVIEYLFSLGHVEVTARYIEGNSASEAMNVSLGMQKVGQAYVDEDGLKWQNVRLSRKNWV